MSKQDYLEIIQKIGAMEQEYLDNQPEYGSLQLKAMQDEINELHLENIKLNLTPKSAGQETEFYVILNSEYEFPDIYEMPSEASIAVTEALYQIYTSYDNNTFYAAVGIDLDNLVALVMNCRELPITSVVKTAGMNNVRHWNATPYCGSLLSMVSTEIEKEATEPTAPSGMNR